MPRNMGCKVANELNIAERIALALLWAKCWCVAIMPHFVRYRIYAPIVYFFMYHVIRYRVKVVDSNLERCLPELSDVDRRVIRRRFYVYLSEIIISTLSLARESSWLDAYPRGRNEGDSEAVDREGTMEHLRKRLDGKTAIVFTAHYGLWEYIQFFPKFSDITSIGVYHPLGNKVFDALFKRLRKRHKTFTVPAKESVRFTIRHGKEYEGEVYILGLIADQNPPLLPDTQWYNFLGEETIFFDGGEKIALRLGVPVYYMYQVRHSAGHYELRYKDIWDGEESVEPHEITRRYVRHLDTTIRQNPELWLWSHRRFKKNRKNKEAWERRKR